MRLKKSQFCKKKYLWILEREGEQARNIDLLPQLFMHPLAASCMCPNQGLLLQPRCIGTMLQPTKPPGRDQALKEEHTNALCVAVILLPCGDDFLLKR